MIVVVHKPSRAAAAATWRPLPGRDWLTVAANQPNRTTTSACCGKRAPTAVYLCMSRTRLQCPCCYACHFYLGVDYTIASV